MKERFINLLIKLLKVDTNKVSDGYHTFEELYEHRIVLYIALCKKIIDEDYQKGSTTRVWRSEMHSDGSVWDGWFILGINKESGEQITYHLPMKYYRDTKFVTTLNKAPIFDGHTPKDVIERLMELTKSRSNSRDM